MDTEQIRRRRQEVVERFGPWTAHNIHLGGDLYTIERGTVGDDVKLRRVTQVVSDLAGRPLSELRVLDLGSLEGLYAIELARHGARVVAVEAREANIEKMRFAREALSLDRFEIVADDVRNLSAEKYGHFDAVLCLGLLYHLDAPDVFHFTARIAEVCTRVAVFDTHVALADETSRRYEGGEYWGSNFLEHAEEETEEQRKAKLWASVGNPNSFWLTKPSLNNLLARVGFTSVYECHNPSEVNKPPDRVTLVAVKGRREELHCSPLFNSVPEERWPEKPRVEESALWRLGRRVATKLLK
ncbi:MAG TPA: class I SAM-dependent methyltransferase [Pyrinomonadaceae bacterium]|jgi:SAM-dependent methyltransferase